MSMILTLPSLSTASKSISPVIPLSLNLLSKRVTFSERITHLPSMTPCLNLVIIPVTGPNNALYASLDIVSEIFTVFLPTLIVES